MALFENGKKYFDKTDMKNVKDVYNAINKKFDIISVG